MKDSILLYNPPSEFYAMPLGLLAVGSVLDRAKYDVRIFDSRIDSQADRHVIDSAENSRCVGMTVFSGAPIRPALELSRQLKQRFPNVPIVWGGWHPSILPEQCVASGAVDVVVIGQGEGSFTELVDAIGNHHRWSTIPGLCINTGDGPRRTPPRPLSDMNGFPPARYDLLDVDSYFRHKAARQIDYSSSRGCPYKCTFCADPIIYQSRWTALSAKRTLDELMSLHEAYGFDEVFFLDDDLFASLKRIQALVDALIEAEAPFGWKGTARADELCRLPEAFFPRLHASGCRRINIGAESGSQKILDQIKKQYRVEQILEAARRTAEAGIGVNCSFIGGFPGETDEDFMATVEVLKQVRKINRDLEASIFFYSPYPGTELVRELESRGLELPQKLEDWAGFTIDSSWLPDPKGLSQRILNLNFYFRHAYSRRRDGVVRRLLQKVSHLRCEHDWYQLPFEPYLARLLR